MSSVAKPIIVGDVTIEGVVCDDIKLDNCYVASIDFSDDMGLTGMLLQHVKQYWVNEPSIISKQLFGFMNTCASVRPDDRVLVTKARLVTLPVDGLHEVRRGAYTVREMLKYKPVLMAIVTVTFNNVVVEQNSLNLGNINVVSYRDVTVTMNSEMVVKEYKLK